MKVLVNIVIVMFLAFLAAPTIVSLLHDEDTEVSVVCGFSEEEMHKEIKEVKMGPQWVYEAAFVPVIIKSTAISSEYLQKHENVCGDIFSPPPEGC
ncbi:hypothetical protein [Flavobacterium psychrotrophum]|uniref:hypothetical protein n=1 Tax=Flavobacterium psychrotrophum TaxID=2294119 RepID=UPI000E3138EE|nr:hypothetical protein [Flavobacterium psychrotrophum]